MAAGPENADDVLTLALRAGPPGAALANAERRLLARRAGPPDVAAAIREALAAATGTDDAEDPAAATALAIAEAVERHGAAFPAGAEPAYHDRHHQAEATIAMGWLAGAARRLGLLGAEEAAVAVAAMAAHDLLHDGKVHAERGLLERRSADTAAAIAERCGMDPADVAEMRRIILATTWPWEDGEAPDLACRLAREADLFGSSLPALGPQLGRLLAVELAMAGQPAPEDVASHAARLALLRMQPPPTPPARCLGLDAVRAAQVAAYGEAARRLGIDPPTPEAGAAALDGMDLADAEALLAWSRAAP
ncbi:hypothetical protein [Neoroseomonas oryzicola]|uniref:HD domain-containing protein n=1 Tax=Neoroseomonas oryzicola TaxID=535904 RepID=A0A9X9WEZ3_9PROT|nr:hypothetical protein [Neoroseomonas oryzicola]MBR0658903.1 hypothetical protein [Neoroseomonas oryzicola]NKE15745.1 hypothetical protein [Neoroseomonas oryzicola]